MDGCRRHLNKNSIQINTWRCLTIIVLEQCILISGCIAYSASPIAQLKHTIYIPSRCDYDVQGVGEFGSSSKTRQDTRGWRWLCRAALRLAFLTQHTTYLLCAVTRGCDREEMINWYVPFMMMRFKTPRLCLRFAKRKNVEFISHGLNEYERGIDR